MAEGTSLLVYPVKDVAAAKDLFSTLLGTEPYVDSPHYVGFRTGAQEIGLDPRGDSNGPIAYWETDDIAARLSELIDAGWQSRGEPKNVGGGLLVASVVDPNGNVVGLRQNP